MSSWAGSLVGLWLMVLGVFLGIFWALLRASWGPPGGLLGASWGPLGGLLGASWATPEGLWAALWRRGLFLIDFGGHFRVQKSLILGLKFTLKWSIDSNHFFGQLGASGGRLGLDFGLILASILGSPGERLDF